jgi:hypothetical protein
MEEAKEDVALSAVVSLMKEVADNEADKGPRIKCTLCSHDWLCNLAPKNSVVTLDSPLPAGADRRLQSHRRDLVRRIQHHYALAHSKQLSKPSQDWPTAIRMKPKPNVTEEQLLAEIGEKARGREQKYAEHRSKKRKASKWKGVLDAYKHYASLFGSRRSEALDVTAASSFSKADRKFRGISHHILGPDMLEELEDGAGYIVVPNLAGEENVLLLKTLLQQAILDRKAIWETCDDLIGPYMAAANPRIEIGEIEVIEPGEGKPAMANRTYMATGSVAVPGEGLLYGGVFALGAVSSVKIWPGSQKKVEANGTDSFGDPVHVVLPVDSLLIINGFALYAEMKCTESRLIVFGTQRRAGGEEKARICASASVGAEGIEVADNTVYFDYGGEGYDDDDDDNAANNNESSLKPATDDNSTAMVEDKEPEDAEMRDSTAAMVDKEPEDAEMRDSSNDKPAVDDCSTAMVEEPTPPHLDTEILNDWNARAKIIDILKDGECVYNAMAKALKKTAPDLRAIVSEAIGEDQLEFYILQHKINPGEPKFQMFGSSTPAGSRQSSRISQQQIATVPQLKELVKHPANAARGLWGDEFAFQTIAEKFNVCILYFETGAVAVEKNPFRVAAHPKVMNRQSMQWVILQLDNVDANPATHHYDVISLQTKRKKKQVLFAYGELPTCVLKLWDADGLLKKHAPTSEPNP